MSFINKYRDHPNQFKVNGKTMISSYEGGCLGNSGWQSLKDQTNGYIMPFISGLEGHFNEWPSLDSWYGLVYFDENIFKLYKSNLISMLAGVVLGLKATIQKMYVNLGLHSVWLNLTALRRTMINTVNEHRSLFWLLLKWLDRYQSTRLKICCHRQRVDVVRFPVPTPTFNL